MPTVQQVGLALGGAAAGLVANMTGLSSRDVAGIAQAAFWVPVSFTGAAVVGGAMRPASRPAHAARGKLTASSKRLSYRARSSRCFGADVRQQETAHCRSNFDA